MTCAEVTKLLSEGVPVREIERREGVQTHVRGCSHCAALLSWAAEPAPGPPGGSMVNKEGVLALLHSDLEPVKPLPSTGAMVVAAFGLAALIAILCTLAVGASGWAGLTALQVACLGLLFVGAILLASFSLSSAIRPGSRQTVHPLVPVLAIAAGFPILVLWLFPAGSREDLLSHGAGCLVAGAMVSTIAGGATFAFARRGYSTDWGRTGALIGAFASAVAATALQIACSEQESGHLVLWHGLAVLLPVTVGYLAGRQRVQS